MKLAALNALSATDARAELMRCCGCGKWADQMIAARPFASRDALMETGARIWKETGPSEWHEAFGHHPRIGDVSKLREKFASTATWAAGEQSGASVASEETLRALADGNEAYEKRFGFIFIVCATGKSAAEMLALLQARISNSPDEELRIAAEEQGKITQLRLGKMIDE